MCFNPRARVGRDLVLMEQSGVVIGVSIHAPAWGATSKFCNHLPDLQSFNPRARVGRDGGSMMSLFQIVCFNPRARVGRDLILYILQV